MMTMLLDANEFDILPTVNVDLPSICQDILEAGIAQILSDLMSGETPCDPIALTSYQDEQAIDCVA